MSTKSQRATRVALLATVLCAVIATAFAAAAFWQHGVAQSKADDAKQHESAAGMFQQAAGEGQAAGTALQQYVTTGDATLIQEINTRTSNGVTLLTGAVQQAGIDGQPLLDGGSTLVQAEGQVIALRQAGNVDAAVAGLQALQSQFQAFLEQQNGIVQAQQAAATDARDKSDSADNVTAWMTIAAALFAIGTIGSGIAYVRASASRRSSLGTLSSA